MIARYWPATLASFDSWIQFFNRSENASNTTISYYDKGSALGMLLDLKIRYETKNERSLDDVMRTLYYDYHIGKNRGFTDQEFRDVCEKIAGCSLDEIFEYASTTRTINYPGYLAYAGLDIDTSSHIQPGIYLGIDTYDRGNSLIISNVEWNSPAWFAGLSPGDTILELNGRQASSELLKEVIVSGTPGNELAVRVGRRTGCFNLNIFSMSNKLKTFAITPLAQPDPFQAKILYNWFTN